MLFLLLQTAPLLKFQKNLLPLIQLDIGAGHLAIYAFLDVGLLFAVDGLVGQCAFRQFFQTCVDILDPVPWIGRHS